MDKETVINQFSEIEQRVEHLIDRCKRLEAENSELKAEKQQLATQLEDQEAEVRQHDELKTVVRSKIESLMGRLDELSEEQV